MDLGHSIVCLGLLGQMGKMMEHINHKIKVNPTQPIGWEDHQKFDLDQRSRSTY